ncbi:MAG: tetratricopeptide repeat protein [Ignavibacteriaceae bacterium]
MLKNKWFFLSVFVVFLLFIDVQLCFPNANPEKIIQDSDSTSSLAFKKNRPQNRLTPFYQPDLSYQLWKQFNLIREANSGDPLAEHELGIRYLLGDGVHADTLLGAYWIHKAVESKLTAAEYNYGILLMNGWGVKWNPFDAYNYFMKAAENEMPQAEYIVGIFHTDNLVVKRDWAAAYRWVKKASDAGFEPAKETLKELKSKVPAALLDTADVKNSDKKKTEDNNGEGNSLSSALGLSFIDFESNSDTVKVVSLKMLQKDLLLTGDKEIIDTLTEFDTKLPEIDSSNVPALLESAESGSPESLNFIGRFYEKGIYYPQNLITALSYYIRALRLDSPRSPWLIYNLIKDKNISGELNKLIKEKDPEAMFVWYGLFAFGFNNQIIQEDAIRLLQQAAQRKFLPALNELGLAFNNGNFIKVNRQKAFAIWEESENLGSMEAKIRLAAAAVFGYLKNSDLDNAVKILESGNDLGSILSQVALAYCYENGIVINQDKAIAVKNYRLAAQRGNQFAYNELKRMYNAIRPDKTEFQVN